MGRTEHRNWELVGPSKSVFEKGGSLAVCIPSHIVGYLDLHPQDQLVFILDKKNRRLIAGKKDAMIIKVGKRKVAFHIPLSARDVIEIVNLIQSEDRRRLRKQILGSKGRTH